MKSFKNLPMWRSEWRPESEGAGIDKSQLFTPELRASIDEWVARYPSGWQQSAVMWALKVVQDANGGQLTNELMDQVAAYLDMPPVAVYEVASFYSMYELKPVGRHKICVCTNVACMICGCDTIVDHLRQRLGIGLGETTPDGRFTLKEVECQGACGGAPMVAIGTRYHENLTPEALDAILDALE